MGLLLFEQLPRLGHQQPELCWIWITSYSWGKKKMILLYSNFFVLKLDWRLLFHSLPAAATVCTHLFDSMAIGKTLFLLGNLSTKQDTQW